MFRNDKTEFIVKGEIEMRVLGIRGFLEQIKGILYLKYQLKC